MVALLLMIGGVAAQRLAELALAARNRRWLSPGAAASTPPATTPCSSSSTPAGWPPGWPRARAGGGAAPAWPLWLALFLAAQALRYWCIVTLGRRWTTRIIVLPGVPRVACGPYRYLRHPNYLAVTVELVCGPLVFGAWLTALTAGLANAWLLLAVRIPAEEEAFALFEE
jgi:methyltransferase